MLVRKIAKLNHDAAMQAFSAFINDQSLNQKNDCFFIKYLRTLGFDVINDIFAESAWHFRNALVRANYNDLKNGIHETTELLKLFLRKLLVNEDHPLHNRSLYISGTFKTSEKANIDNPKANIEREKLNIEDAFTAKTASRVCKLLDKFGFQTVLADRMFRRSLV